MDHLIPALSKNLDTVLPIPATNAQITRIIRMALLDNVNTNEVWGTTDIISIEEEHKLTAGEAIARFTLSSMRVFMSEWAHKAGISRERRKIIGRSATECTADVYTRQHRVVVMDIWKETTAKRHLME